MPDGNWDVYQITGSPTESTTFNASTLEKGLGVTGISKCAEWWNSANGPGTLGYQAAGLYWKYPRAMVTEQLQHTPGLFTYTYTIQRRAGCTEVYTASHNSLVNVCGCKEMWCPILPGTYLLKPGGPCHTAVQIFGCFHINAAPGTTIPDTAWYPKCGDEDFAGGWFQQLNF
jgi:hypothetical protein